MDTENLTTTAPAEVEDHGTITEVLFGFWETFIDFIKFMFYGIFIGDY